MKPAVRTGLLLLLGSLALAGAFIPPQGPAPLRRQNAMRMSYRDNEPLAPPTDDDLEALERRLTPSVAAWLRLASAVVMGGAYLASPVMGAWVAWVSMRVRLGPAWVWLGLVEGPSACGVSYLYLTSSGALSHTHSYTNSPAPRRGRDEHDGADRERHGGHLPRYVNSMMSITAIQRIDI